MSQGRAYQLLRAAHVVECTTVHSLQLTSQVPESEAIARELVPLLNNPKALNSAWNDAVRNAGGVPTAKEVREIVARNLVTPLIPNKPLHDLEGPFAGTPIVQPNTRATEEAPYPIPLLEDRG